MILFLERKVSAALLLVIDVTRLRLLLPDEVFPSVMEWRTIEKWKREKLNEKSLIFRGFARSGNVMDARTVLEAHDMPQKCVKYLINNIDGMGVTALMEAASHGQPGMIRFLIEIGYANGEMEDKDGKVVTHFAAENGRLHSVMYLLEKFPNHLHFSDRNNNSLLTLASTNGQTAVMEFLIEKKAYLEHYNAEGRTSLHLSAVNGHLNAVKLLTTKGADIFARDLAGDTPLHLACKNSHLDIVNFLLQTNIDLRTVSNNAGQTALDIAMKNNNEGIIEVLTNGPSPSTQPEPANSLPLLPPQRVIDEQPISPQVETSPDF